MSLADQKKVYMRRLQTQNAIDITKMMNESPSNTRCCICITTETGLKIYRWLNIIASIIIIVVNSMSFQYGTEYIGQAIPFVFVNIILAVSYFTGEIKGGATSVHLSQTCFVNLLITFAQAIFVIFSTFFGKKPWVTIVSAIPNFTGKSFEKWFTSI